MANLFVFLTLTFAFLPALLCQSCAGRAGFGPGSTSCCNNPSLSNTVFDVCCKETDGSCYCNLDRWPICSELPAAITQAPAAPAPPTLCPPRTRPVQSRILDSNPVTDVCSGGGVIGLNANASQFCNAAFVIDASTGDRVLYTITSCWEAVQTMQGQGGIPITGEIFGDSFPLDDCAVKGSNASDYNPSMTKVTLSSMAGYFIENHLDSCMSPGCIYNGDTMRNAVNLSDCFMTSYGFSSLAEGIGGELHRLSLKVSDATQCQNAPLGSQCFVSGQLNRGSTCLGDNGSPVYCMLSTGEEVLYGVAASDECNQSVHSFNVIPIPAF